MDLMKGDRRTGRRFELELSLRYEVLNNGRCIRSGAGRTVDMGSGGLLVWTDRALQAGEQVRLSIDWLLPDRDGVSVDLLITGEVVRAAPGFAGVRMQTWEFQRNQPLLVRQRPAARSRVAVAAQSIAVGWLN